LKSYRFSIAWGRVLPAGRGTVNPAGLDFYERLVDALLDQDIEPMVTLYHWDLPAALDDRGGWLNPDIVHWFAEYASVVFRKLDDRVKLWVTLNEPWVVSDGGYLQGVLAPGHRNRFEAPLATHHQLCAHGAAVSAYRTHGKHAIGIVVNLEPKYPASASDADRIATACADAYMNGQYLDPIFLGRYPEEMTEIFGAAWLHWPEEDYALIQAPVDFLGVNYYSRGVMRFVADAWPLRAVPVPQTHAKHTEMGWEVFPQGLTDALVRVKERYANPPLYVTENGAAFPDPPIAARDPLDDPLRVAYLREHLAAAHEALARGVDLRGYYAWSLLDNFEWAQGYAKRFGIVHVDFATQRRTRKASALYYSDVIAANGLEQA
jgi:beta-glucosidase